MLPTTFNLYKVFATKQLLEYHSTEDLHMLMRRNKA